MSRLRAKYTPGREHVRPSGRCSLQVEYTSRGVHLAQCAAAPLVAGGLQLMTGSAEVNVSEERVLAEHEKHVKQPCQFQGATSAGLG